MAAEEPRAFTAEQKRVCAAIFDTIDTDGKGKLAYEDLFHLMRMLMVDEGVSSSDAAIEHGCRRGFEAIDADGDGMIDRDELENFLAAQCTPERVGGDADEDVDRHLSALLENYTDAIDIPPPPPLDAHPDDLPPPPAEEDTGLDDEIEEGDEDAGEDDDDGGDGGGAAEAKAE